MNQPVTNTTITILGTGYVGLTTAALFAAAGIKTYVVDPNDERLESVRRGKSFFYEEGLDALVAYGIKNGTLIPTASYTQSVPHSDIVISSVGTPDNPDGSSNLQYIFAAAQEAAQHFKPGAVYVQKSTVPVGTGAKVMQTFKDAHSQVTYVSNPEFLRESTALRDSLWFDRIVVGGSNGAALERVLDAYRQVQGARDTIAAISGLDGPTVMPTERYMATTLESAELIKVSANAFLALKISFANSVAKLADKAGGDVVEIMDAVGADTRIGRAFLNAGRGYGGGCFPKDVSGLINGALAYGVDFEIMRAVQTVNSTMPGYIVEKLQDALGGSLDGKKIAVLGLAFKAGTSDTRKSSGVTIANILAADGAIVTSFDPQAHAEARHSLHENVVLSPSALDAIAGADAVIIATDWPEFLHIKPAVFASTLSGTIFVDAMNRFDKQAITSAGLRYIGVGRST